MMKNKKNPMSLSVILSVRVLLVLLAIAMVFSFAACANTPTDKSTETEGPAGESVTVAGENDTSDDAETEKIAAEGLWKDAIYRSDKSFGTGSKTIYVAVVVEDSIVTFTLHTDAETLGEALLAEKLVEGETSQYGLYIKKVNGITADYDKDKSWWGLSKDGKDLMTGADGETISDGASYAITYTK